MPRKRILAFSFFPAYVPPRSGGVERLLRIYSSLSQRFDVTLISSGEVGSEIEQFDHGPGFTEIRVAKGPEFVDAYEDLRNHSGGGGDLSGPAIGLSCKLFNKLHEQYLVHYPEAEIIVHDSPFLIECDLFRGFDQKVRVYNSYNCETDLYASFHSNETDRRVEKLVHDLEQDLCNNADLITACSDSDRQRFRELFKPAAPVELAPNGVNPLEVKGRAPAGKRLIFIGSDHRPNVEAAKLIADELAPKYREWEFHIVGSCFPPTRRRNLVAHGVVDAATKRQLLQSAFAAINPISTGSGSSLKVADIAAAGVPLVSTELGVRGFDLEDGKHYIRLRRERFVSELGGKLRDSSQLSAVAHEAREHIVENYSWSAIAAHFGDRLEELTSTKSSSKPYLVLNDYDSFATTGGGATRTQGLCQGLAESRPAIFLCFNDEAEATRRVSEDGKILSLLVKKTERHQEEEDRDHALHWISTADVVNYLHAPQNPRMLALFRCAASVSEHVICEHPYMVGLVQRFGVDFTYSSQNFEYGLKSHSLRDHPRVGPRLACVREAEAFACGASSLVVAVSEDDARALGGEYRFTAPIMVVPNGAEGPAKPRPSRSAKRDSKRKTAVFIGSGHGPNVEAAQWIVEKLAPAVPAVDFVMLGGVAKHLSTAHPNVKLVGRVDPDEKTRHLYNADVALNPMMSGSGSNVKLADYLQHGLPALSTPFGARGYETITSDDVTIAELTDFPEALRKVCASTAGDAKNCSARQKRYLKHLSMIEGGRHLHRLIEEHSGDRRRALYVTYRYNSPSRGGGEEHVVRLVHALARNGWNIDIVSPAAEKITDRFRFAAQFEGDRAQPVPTGIPRVRSGKFELDAAIPTAEEVKRFWSAQPEYEEEFFRRLPGRPDRSTLTWGWSYLSDGGRWCFNRSGLFLVEPATVLIAGETVGKVWLQIFSDEGKLIDERELSNKFKLECDVPAGFVRFDSTVLEPIEDDLRPLSFFVRRLEADGVPLIQDSPVDIWSGVDTNSAETLLNAYARARELVRDRNGLELSEIRNASDSLLAYVRENVDSYDLVITHNAVFGSSIGAVASAQAAKVPSIFIPHLHYDDDFYHFSDVFNACKEATRTLVCPSVTQDFLAGEGLANLEYHTPGVVADQAFGPDDVRAFRSVLNTDEDFFLVLGRKAGAKGYADVVHAGEQLKGGRSPLVVLIGPDDDGVPLRGGRAIYLGRQPNDVVRGALMECLALVNMSRSESFGMVLLEAGLANKPVIANANCAAFADIVDDGVNGLMVTPEGLPRAMTTLWKDASLRQKMGKANRKIALKYDWAIIEKNFINLCNSLVDK
jgi:glycosyltransferase involved in cell wall biosynthesis